MSCYEPRNLGCYHTGKPVTGTALIIPVTLCIDELRQGDCFDFIIPCNFCYPTCISNVHLLINNTVTLHVIKNGAVKSDQISKRTRYTAVVGTEFNTATIRNVLCPSKFPFPEIDATSLSGQSTPIQVAAESASSASSATKKEAK